MERTFAKWTSLNESYAIANHFVKYIISVEKVFGTICEMEFYIIYLLNLQQSFHRTFAITNSRIYSRS